MTFVTKSSHMMQKAQGFVYQKRHEILRLLQRMCTAVISSRISIQVTQVLCAISGLKYSSQEVVSRQISGKGSLSYYFFHVVSHVLLMAVSVSDQQITHDYFPSCLDQLFFWFFCKVLLIDLTFAVRVQNELFYYQDPTFLYMTQ